MEMYLTEENNAISKKIEQFYKISSFLKFLNLELYIYLNTINFIMKFERNEF